MLELYSVPLGLLVAILVVYYWAPRSSLGKLPFPPSPPKHWLFGHANFFSTPHVWNLFTSWKEEYGDVIHLEAFGNHTLVLNSLDDAIELLEKRSNNYSDRAYIPMIEMSNWTYATTFKNYGPEWQQHRRLFKQEFNPTATMQYRDKQSDKINNLLNNLLESPDNFMAHVRTLSAAVIMSTVYGYDLLSMNDQFVSIAEEGMARLSESIFPGARLVNLIHSLRYLPSWFPGTGFQKYAADVAKVTADMQNLPYEYTKKAITAGTAAPCFVSSLIDGCNTEEDHNLLRQVAATGYAGGADTTTSAISTFILAMAKYPDVQKKAQEEVDRVVGAERMPTFEEQEAMPYVQAVLREVLRWRPVVPLGVVHSPSADDVYKGCFIPKGTSVMPNVWAISRDARKYQNPEEFIPERFFGANKELNDDDVSYAFGFGRRICPGQYLAFDTMWLAIARVLAAFDIQCAKDAEGRDIPLSGEYTDGFLVHPLPFRCAITPRSEKAKALIVDAAHGY